MAEPQQTLMTQGEELDTIRALLAGEKMQEQFQIAIPKHCDVDRLVRLALTQLRLKPKLLDCNRQSLFGAIMEAGQMGLEIGVGGQCWMIPYKGEVALRIGYRGMCELSWRSEKIRSIDARVVCENDEFDYRFGTERFLHHVKGKSDKRGAFTHAYAIVETTKNGTMFDVMDRPEVEAIRDRSPSYIRKSGPWLTDPGEMWKKTPLRRLLKITPSSTELQRAVTLDEQADLGISQDLGAAIDVTPDNDNEVPIAANVPEENE